MENFHRNQRGLFGEAAGLIKEPMLAVVQRGQDILDATIKGLGVPPFKLNGATNAVTYLTDQLERVSRNETGDLEPFWRVSQ